MTTFKPVIEIFDNMVYIPLYGTKVPRLESGNHIWFQEIRPHKEVWISNYHYLTGKRC